MHKCQKDTQGVSHFGRYLLHLEIIIDFLMKRFKAPESLFYFNKTIHVLKYIL